MGAAAGLWAHAARWIIAGSAVVVARIRMWATAHGHMRLDSLFCRVTAAALLVYQSRRCLELCDGPRFALRSLAMAHWSRNVDTLSGGPASGPASVGGGGGGAAGGGGGSRAHAAMPGGAGGASAGGGAGGGGGSDRALRSNGETGGGGAAEYGAGDGGGGASPRGRGCHCACGGGGGGAAGGGSCCCGAFACCCQRNDGGVYRKPVCGGGGGGGL